MSDMSADLNDVARDESVQPGYVPPVVRVMSEAEVLSAFQVTAASPTSTWWAC